MPPFSGRSFILLLGWGYIEVCKTEGIREEGLNSCLSGNELLIVLVPAVLPLFSGLLPILRSFGSRLRKNWHLNKEEDINM